MAIHDCSVSVFFCQPPPQRTQKKWKINFIILVNWTFGVSAKSNLKKQNTYEIESGSDKKPRNSFRHFQCGNFEFVRFSFTQMKCLFAPIKSTESMMFRQWMNALDNWQQTPTMRESQTWNRNVEYKLIHRGSNRKISRMMNSKNQFGCRDKSRSILWRYVIIRLLFFFAAKNFWIGMHVKASGACRLHWSLFKECTFFENLDANKLIQSQPKSSKWHVNHTWIRMCVTRSQSLFHKCIFAWVLLLLLTVCKILLICKY